MTVDIRIVGGEVADGVSDRTYRADILVKDGRIVGLGDQEAEAAALTIDARGLIVMPGFIDTHVHLDAFLLADHVHTPTLRQGITTVIVGQDGTSFFPSSALISSQLGEYFAPINGVSGEAIPWTIESYLGHVDGRSNLNVAALVPHGNLRAGLVEGRHELTTGELSELKRRLADAFAQGAVGVSTGLHYVPSRYADAAELDAIGQAAAEAGRPHVTHMRGYGAEAAVALAEVADSAHRTGSKLHISHLMAPAAILSDLDSRIQSGAPITFDSYPYDLGFSILTILALPPWAQDGGKDTVLERLVQGKEDLRLDRWWTANADRIGGLRVAYAGRDVKLPPGATVREMADGLGVQVGEFIRRTLIESDLQATALAPNGLASNDLHALAAHPSHMGGSDGIYVGEKPHPRGWGAFARFLKQEVVDGGRWSWADAAKHLAAIPARTFGLDSRGVLRVGARADIAVVDPKEIADNATLENPTREAIGVRHVIVNGAAALLDSRVTGERPGRALRWQGTPARS